MSESAKMRLDGERGAPNENDANCGDWANLAQWLKCMCVVTFDLNLGQALEFVYPPQFTPTEQEISNICYMAFPDSNSGCMGDTKFHMRFRMTPDPKRRRAQTKGRYNGDCVSVLKSDNSHYWGFVYFRQKRDAKLPRGYFQKSFILVTQLPFFNLFYEVVGLIATRFFNEGNSALEEVCHQINEQWPVLQAGTHLRLPVYEQVFQLHIPKASSRKSTPPADEKPSRQNELAGTLSSATIKILPSANELDLFYSLGFVVDHLYTLWELVLVGEPIVVVGTSPADTSHMVQTLVQLIQPLEYFTEVRPYFTIHDSEFKEFTKESDKIPNIILGVTNPFFVKLLKHWPHMLRLVDTQMNMQHQQLLHKNMYNSNSVSSFNSSTAGTTNTMPFKKTAAATSSASTSSLISSDGSAPGLYSKYKPFLKKDKSLIKKVLLGMKTKRPDHVQTALLRRHLLELTQSFMIPLERYVASLMPLQKDISPFKSAPNANAFKLDDFLATLELSGPHLTSPLKGDWKGLYRRFFNSSNFRGWFDSRYRELQLTLQDLQLQALSEANLEQWARDKQEVEIIDMILKLKQKLNLYGGDNNTPIDVTPSCNSATTMEQIRSQIACMKELLPHDLKNVVNL